MADITGYSQLGLVGFTDKGDYAAGNTYMMNDLVHYQNSVWRCKADQTSGVTPGENNNWTIFVNGTNDLNAIIAADVQGLLGEAGAQGVNAQKLINAIAEKVATKVLMKTDLVSQIVNDATKAASMAALYAVNEKIGDVENLPNSAEDVVAAIVQQNSNKAPVENPSLKFDLGYNGAYAEFRRGGSQSDTLALVYNAGDGTSSIFNLLINSDGKFLPDFPVRILNIQTISISDSSQVADKGTWSATGTFLSIDGATDYLLIPQRCNYGCITGLSRSGNKITATAINTSGVSHSCTITLYVVAYKTV